MMPIRPMVALLGLMISLGFAAGAHAEEAEGWKPLFNGKDFTNWRVPDDGPWTIVDGVIDVDPARGSERGDAWTQEHYEDFVLHVEWRFTEKVNELPLETRPVIAPDGSTQTDSDGNAMTRRVKNGDSGIYLRGQSKAQVNIWNWTVGSGEVYGYRTDGSMSEEVRRGVTPLTPADNRIGEWNTFIITMVGDRLSVLLNGKIVLNHAQLPGVAESGPIGLQLHGSYNAEDDSYSQAAALVQFRNIHIKPLNAD
ncbi:MAG: DUF1080 domain-containing protein [Phycisphaeraceae bacterium]